MDEYATGFLAVARRLVFPPTTFLMPVKWSTFVIIGHLLTYLFSGCGMYWEQGNDNGN